VMYLAFTPQKPKLRSNSTDSNPTDHHPATAPEVKNQRKSRHCQRDGWNLLA